MGKNNKTSTIKPRVLVVLPTLGKRNDLLRQTLKSIASQKPITLDIVMIFPLKNQETKKLAKEYGAIMVDDPGGMSKAVNAGIAMAKPWHEYITWIGDDDYLKPGSLKTTAAALDSDNKAVVAFGYCEYINEDGKHIFTSRAGRFAPWVMRWGPNLVPMPGLLLRKSALEFAGIFDPKNKYSMDLDMLLRLRKQGKFINTRKVLAAFRWHANSQTVSNRDVVIKETEAVKRKYLPRPLQIISPIWHRPVRLATKIAARRVTAIANRAK
jgi:GT2 family glycosyltransferase